MNTFNLSSDLVIVEITENTFLNNNMEQIQKLKDMGIKISIDDFGTGYSSLSYLQEYPVDSIKIDKFLIYLIFLNQT